MCDPETYCMKIPKEVNSMQIKIYDFCCINYPWELYLMEFDLYLLSKPKYETYKSAIGYCVVNATHMKALRDIYLDNDYNKIMSLYTQDYPMT